MAYPNKPDSTYDYSTFQAENPTTPLPADQVEAGFNEHKQSVDGLIDFVKLSIRSDNKISAKMVPAAALAPDAVALIGGWNPRGLWTTATSYAVKDVVSFGTFTYVCVTAHTSGSFTTDLGAGKWMYLSFEQPTSYAVSLFADIEALPARPAVVVVYGKLAVNDGFGGHFYWAKDDVTTADGVDVIQPTTGEAGRYKRLDSAVRSDVALPTVQALRDYVGATVVALVSSRATFGDGGSGRFMVKIGDTTTADDGVMVLVDALGRRWWRIWDITIQVDWFPSHGGTAAANTAGVQAAIDCAIDNGAVLGWGARKYILNDMQVSAPTKWRGAGGGGYADGAESGTILFRAAGTDADFITVEMNSLFQEGSAGKWGQFDIEDIALVGNWGNNASGGGLIFEDGENGGTSAEYGHSVTMRNCQIHEFNGPNLYLGINRNAALIDKCIFRWSFDNVLKFGGSCGDHRITDCEFAGAQNTKSNIATFSTFATTFIGCHSYVATAYGIDIDENTSAFLWVAGEINGNAFGAGRLIGLGLGNDYPVTFVDALVEANSTVATNTYADFTIVDRTNVKLDCRHYSGGTTKAKYLVEITGASYVQLGGNYTSDAFGTDIVNDWTKVQLFAPHVKIFTGASYTHVGGNAFSASLDVLNTSGPINAWGRINSSNVGVVQLVAQTAGSNAGWQIFGTGAGGVQLELVSGRLGFFGMTPIAKPTVTGAKGGNTALTDLLAKLAALGVITDSTT